MFLNFIIIYSSESFIMVDQKNQIIYFRCRFKKKTEVDDLKIELLQSVQITS